MAVASILWYLALSSLLMVGQYFLEKRFSRGLRRPRETRAAAGRTRGAHGGGHRIEHGASRRPAAGPMVKAEGVRKSFGTHRGAQGHRPGGRAARGHVRRSARPGRASRRSCAASTTWRRSTPAGSRSTASSSATARRGGKLHELRDSEVAAAAAGHRHGVPAVQPLPAHDGAGERHRGAVRVKGSRKEAVPRAGAALLERVGLGDRVARLPEPALRRPAAAGGDRPRAGDGAQADALRRADLARWTPNWSARCSTSCAASPESGMTMVVVTHEMGFAREVGDTPGVHGRRRRRRGRRPRARCSPTRSTSAPGRSCRRCSDLAAVRAAPGAGGPARRAPALGCCHDSRPRQWQRAAGAGGARGGAGRAAGPGRAAAGRRRRRRGRGRRGRRAGRRDPRAARSAWSRRATGRAARQSRSSKLDPRRPALPGDARLRAGPRGAARARRCCCSGSRRTWCGRCRSCTRCSHRGWERPYVGAGVTLYDPMALAGGHAAALPGHRHLTRSGALRARPRCAGRAGRRGAVLRRPGRRRPAHDDDGADRRRLRRAGRQPGPGRRLPARGGAGRRRPGARPGGRRGVRGAAPGRSSTPPACGPTTPRRMVGGAGPVPGARLQGRPPGRAARPDPLAHRADPAHREVACCS